MIYLWNAPAERGGDGALDRSAHQAARDPKRCRADACHRTPQSPCRHAKRSLAFARWSFVSELRLPFSADFDIHFAAIDSGRVGGRESHSVSHRSHAAHLRHVKIE